MQNDGVDTTLLEEQIKKYKPKFFYTIPTFQNPSGITMSAEKGSRYTTSAANTAF